jgi:hypothetical protein
MGVPPRSAVTVKRRALPGVRLLIDGTFLAGWRAAALQEHGASAALAILDGWGERQVRGCLRGRPTASDVQQLDGRLRQGLADAAVPDAIGVFVVPSPADVLTPVAQTAAIAALARRSGPLYLPRRPFAPSLIVPARVLLMFPEA